MKILVTGGAGFIGSHIVGLYIKKGHQVAVVDDLSHGKKQNVHKKASFFHEDINSPHLEKIFAKFKPYVVNHHAALVNVNQSMEDPTLDAKINVLGTINLLENAKKTKVKQFIFASSVAVYGEPKEFPIKEDDLEMPISFYGISKLIAEKYINLYKDHFSTTILRYSNVYGPRQDSSAEGGVVTIFINNLLKNKDCIIYGNGKQTRDFIYVSDIAQANLLALNSPKENLDVFNISTGQETTVLGLYKLLKNKISETRKIKVTDAEFFVSRTDPERIPIKSGRVEGSLFTKPREGDIKKSVLDNSRAKRILGWKPKYKLEKGIEETIKYFRN